MTPEQIEEMRRAPHAYSVEVFFCENPRCLRPHVALFDVEGRVIASFVVPDPHLDHGFMHDLQGALYRSAVERGDKTVP